jgi:hypothetical protein
VDRRRLGFKTEPRGLYGSRVRPGAPVVELRWRRSLDSECKRNPTVSPRDAAVSKLFRINPKESA